MDDPLTIGAGVARGVGSFGRHAITGVANTTAGITGSVAKGLLVLACDDKYLAERRRRQREKPKDLGSGFVAGATALGTGEPRLGVVRRGAWGCTGTCSWLGPEAVRTPQAAGALDVDSFFFQKKFTSI